MLLHKVLILSALSVCTAFAAFQPEQWAIIHSQREDARHVSSRGVLQAMLEDVQPACAFSPKIKNFGAWQQRVRSAMQKLMQPPPACRADRQPPKRLQTVQREGYRVERWEAYPLPHAAVPFLVLVPDSVNKSAPAPAIFCIPGSGQTKEQVAGEPSRDLSAQPPATPHNSAMALHFVREGWVAIAVDNAGSGEEADAEQAAGRAGYDDDNLARFLLELGWSWLGYTTHADQCILDWVKKQPIVQRDRIVLCGFSLGTEPLMTLGALNPDIFAFVYNDFLCRTLERIQVMTKPDARGARPAPNSIRHLIPGFLLQFDFPDLVAALAPRPVICVEGGLDRDFQLVKQAYRLAGAERNFTYYHQPAFADSEKRWQGERLPAGLNRNQFFRLANVDPRNHNFKKDLILPWLRELFSHPTPPAKHVAPPAH